VDGIIAWQSALTSDIGYWRPLVTITTTTTTIPIPIQLQHQLLQQHYKNSDVNGCQNAEARAQAEAKVEAGHIHIFLNKNTCGQCKQNIPGFLSYITVLN